MALFKSFRRVKIFSRRIPQFIWGLASPNDMSSFRRLDMCYI